MISVLSSGFQWICVVITVVSVRNSVQSEKPNIEKNKREVACGGGQEEDALGSEKERALEIGSRTDRESFDFMRIQTTQAGLCNCQARCAKKLGMRAEGLVDGGGDQGGQRSLLVNDNTDRTGLVS